MCTWIGWMQWYVWQYQTITWEQAQELAKSMSEVILFRDEAQMLKTFLDLIDDCDVLSGWNSEGYDIPIL